MSDSQKPDASNWYVVIAGMPPPQGPVQLAAGVTLAPLGSHLSVFDLASAGSVGFRQWAILEGIAATCSCEMESAMDAAILPGYDTLNRAWLASALLVLRGFSSHIAPACCSYSWNTIAGYRARAAPSFKAQLTEEGVEAAVFSPKETLPPFRGQILDFHLEVLAHDARRSGAVTDDDASWIRSHFEIFNALAAQSESFRFALESAHDWRFSRDPRIAVARLWSGIEALFRVSSELVFRLSLLSSSLLEPRGEGRKRLFEHVKQLYDQRSKLVHGQSLSDDKTAFAMNGSFDLLRRLLLHQIEIGHPFGPEDFDNALFL